MMDNLYMDKLRGELLRANMTSITSQSVTNVMNLTVKVDQLQEAEDNYFITAKYVLELINRAYELFMSSEVEEKRQLIKLVLSNLSMDDENVV